MSESHTSISLQTSKTIYKSHVEFLNPVFPEDFTIDTLRDEV